MVLARPGKYTAAYQNLIFGTNLRQTSNCLSQSREHGELNQMCVRQAMLELYPVLKMFIDDNGPNWATEYYNEVVKTQMSSILEQTLTGKENILNRHCNVLFVLDPDKQYAHDLYKYVRAAVFSQMLPQPTGDHSGAPWLPDTIKWLTDVLANSDRSELDPDVREALFKDFEYLCNEQQKEFNRKKRDDIARVLTESFDQLINIEHAIGGIKVIGTGVWLRSSDALKNQALVQQGHVGSKGGKALTIMKVG